MANLITKAEYKAYAGITSTNHDAEIDSLIPKISALVKSYCRRAFVDFAEEPKVETFSGGFKELLLSETPVIQVISVQYSADYGQTFTRLVKFTDWINSDTSIVSLASGGFAEALNGYKVTYLAGYETVPDDLKLGILDLVDYYRKNDGAVHSNKAPSANGVQVEYITTASFPSHIRRVLDLYVSHYA